jgi:hypothetical protein
MFHHRLLRWLLYRCPWLGPALSACLRFLRRRPRRSARPGVSDSGLGSVLESARRAGRAEERFHASLAEERELGRLYPPPTGPRPEPGAEEPERQRAQPARDPPGRGR